MKFWLAVAILFLAGCGGGQTTTQQPAPTPPTPSAPTLTGTWAGNITGLNFTGSEAIDTNLTQTGTTVTGSILAPTGACAMSAQLQGSITGSAFSLTDTSGTFVMYAGTLSQDGKSISGNISFAADKCGTQQNPWQATFSQVKQ